MSQLFASGGLSIGASTSAIVLPTNIPMISFRIGWFDLLAVQGTLKSFPQRHISKASILQPIALFMVQLSFFSVFLESQLLEHGPVGAQDLALLLLWLYRHLAPPIHSALVL